MTSWRLGPTDPNGCGVLAVGFGPAPLERLKATIRDALGYSGLLTIRVVQRLPERDLACYAAILVHGSCPPMNVVQIFANPDLAWRSRVVVDSECLGAGTLFEWLRSPTVPFLVLHPGAGTAEARGELRRILTTDPVVFHIAPSLWRAISPPQLLMVEEVLRRSAVRSVTVLARLMHRSERSLLRDCHALGLQPPGALLVTSRLMRGVTWAALRDTGAEPAALVAGYAHVRSFRRALRAAYGVPFDVLIPEWRDPNCLVRLLRDTLLRHTR
jgi:AraC-like DNA-binding protein